MTRHAPRFAAAALTLLFSIPPAAFAAPPTMQAIVQTKGLDPAGLALREVPTPSPGPGELLIKVYAAGVNPVDWKRQAGGSGPAIPGFDVAGVVEALGPGVSGFRTGEAVFARADRAYAQYAVTSAQGVVRKPASLRFEQAAGIPVAGLAGFRSVDSAQVKAGQRVAIVGAAGGTGSAAVQIAKARGATVIAIGHSSQSDFLRRLGADEVLAYDRDDVGARVKDVDAVLNMVDGQANPAMRYVKRGGRLASIAGTTDEAACRAAGLTCVRIGPGYQGAMSEADELRALARLAEEGKYVVTVTRSFPLAEAAAAQAEAQRGETIGKYVLVVDPKSRER